ncbi:hypothetical protein [Kineobactrum salinum]|uniref:Uncharacterized protein n=1 Tax=Kineobactrum salinum TaxID=2708301 RepID=A0A6C0U4W6_9GAMM|nr:hypothetical protein [Kineobactrum salinum]QIB67151.1 hypothetical protein G3T16_18840 [Kineobactrum salinum]
MGGNHFHVNAANQITTHGTCFVPGETTAHDIAAVIKIVGEPLALEQDNGHWYLTKAKQQAA